MAASRSGQNLSATAVRCTGETVIAGSGAGGVVEADDGVGLAEEL